MAKAWKSFSQRRCNSYTGPLTGRRRTSVPREQQIGMHQIPGGGSWIDGTRQSGGARTAGDLDAVGRVGGRLQVNGENAARAMLPHELAEISQHSHLLHSGTPTTPIASMLEVDRIRRRVDALSANVRAVARLARRLQEAYQRAASGQWRGSFTISSTRSSGSTGLVAWAVKPAAIARSRTSLPA
jgi:hypothetical protein